MYPHFATLSQYSDQVDQYLLCVNEAGVVCATNNKAQGCQGKTLSDYCTQQGYLCPIAKTGHTWQLTEHAALGNWHLGPKSQDKILLTGEKWVRCDEQQADLYAYLDVLPFAVFRKDTQGRYTWANQFQCQMLREDFIGKTDDVLCWAKYAAVLKANDQKVMRKRRGMTFEEITCNSQGEVQCAYSTKIPTYDPVTGVLQGIMGFAIPAAIPAYEADITIQPFFTNNELAILYWLGRGKGAQEIGELLHKSPRTIEDIIGNSKQKVGVKKVYQLGYCLALLQPLIGPMINGIADIRPKDSPKSSG